MLSSSTGDGRAGGRADGRAGGRAGVLGPDPGPERSESVCTQGMRRWRKRQSRLASSDRRLVGKTHTIRFTSGGSNATLALGTGAGRWSPLSA